MTGGSAEITVLLRAWRNGDQAAFDRLWSIVHNDLLRMARRYMRAQQPGHTLQTTALLNEAWVRLAGVQNAGWRDRAQFFALSAQVMRRILVDTARARGARKRGSGRVKVNVEDVPVLSPEQDRSILALHDVLEEFAKIAPRQARVVELRYFGGMNVDEIVEVLNVSARTVERDWEFSRIWLKRALSN
jgi:RNA polymerase sigma factor (TIGR02999 family)